jgi:Sulfocyanin (SoxE) domain
VTRLQAAVAALLVAAATAACASAASSTSGWVFAPPPSAQPSLSASPSSVIPTASAVVPSPPPAVSPSPVAASPSGGLTITLSEWQVEVPGTATAGASTYTITNAGTTPHELLVFKSDLDPVAYPVDASGRIKEVGAGVTLLSDGDNIAPGGSQTRSIDLTPGRYLFVCNIPGHFRRGMYAVVTVGN